MKCLLQAVGLQAGQDVSSVGDQVPCVDQTLLPVFRHLSHPGLCCFLATAALLLPAIAS